MKVFRIALLPGDGIGPEVLAEGVKVLRAIQSRLRGVEFALTELQAGAAEYQRNGEALPEKVFQQCADHDAILFGAMGLPGVRQPSGVEIAPQLDIRERLDLYRGLRPVRLYHRAHSPLKGYAAGTIDLLIVRENTEGMFSSRAATFPADAAAVEDTLRITRRGAERIVRAAFHEAAQRRGRLTLVDKSNVLPSMVFLRRIFDEAAEEFPAIETERIYIDAASLYLVQRPESFDVIVTENLFGDILSDLAAGLVGGMGMAPSADIGDHHAMFQPAHGSAPDIAGQGIANPVAAILSVAMMLDWLGEAETRRGSALIREAVQRVLENEQNRTRDLGGALSTQQMGDLIREALGG